MPPPKPAALLDPLSFPPNVASTILKQAGPYTRQVCHAYRDLHPPLLALAPHGPTNPAQVQAALATLPPTPTSLDLRSIPVPLETLPFTQPHPLTPAALAAIPRALPRLLRLHLPPIPAALLPSLLLCTLPSCPHLHTLTVPSLTTHPHPSPTHTHPSWAPLLHPPIATRLRSLSLPACALPALHSAPPASLPLLTSLTLTSRGSPLDATHLAPALPATAPSLCSLHLLDTPCLLHPDRLPPLAPLLTAFSLTITHPTPHPSTAPHLLLPPIATLTRLRSLCLALPSPHLHPPPADAPTTHLLLSRLTALTRLHFTLRCQPSPTDPTAPQTLLPPTAAALLTALAAASAHLHLLRDLHLAFSPSSRCTTSAHSWPPCSPPTAFFRHLAAATHLHSLSLGSLPLPPAEAGLLTHLQALTSLTLHHCATHSHCCTWSPTGGRPPHPLRWVSALTTLQALAWHEPLPARRPVSPSPAGNAYPPAPELPAQGPPAGSRLPLLEAPSDDEPLPPWLPVASLPRLHTLDIGVDVLDVTHGGPLAGLLVGLGGQLTRLQLGASKLAGWAPGAADPEGPGRCSRASAAGDAGSGAVCRAAGDAGSSAECSGAATVGSRAMCCATGCGGSATTVADSTPSSAGGSTAGCSGSHSGALNATPGGAPGRSSTPHTAARGSVLQALEAMPHLQALELRGLTGWGKGAALLQHLRLPRGLRLVLVDKELRGCALLEQLRERHPLVVFRPVPVWK